MKKKSPNQKKREKKLTKFNEWRPTPLQIKMVELLINPDDNRTKEDKCNEVGVKRQTLYNWLKIPEFVEYMNSRVNEYTDTSLPDIWKAHIRQATRGNIQAIELYYKMKGMLVDQKNIKQEISGELKVSGNLSPEERRQRIDELLNRTGRSRTSPPSRTRRTRK